MTASAGDYPLPVIAIVCFGMGVSRLHKQPWHSVWGIAKGLRDNGFHIAVITDDSAPPRHGDIRVIQVPCIYDDYGPSVNVREAIVELAPERVMIVAGTHELLRHGRFSFSVPVTLILASQRFRLRELARMAPIDWFREWHLLKLPLVQSLLPAGILRRQARVAGLAHPLYFSRASQARHGDAGLPLGTLVTPRIEPGFIPDVVNASSQSNDLPVICYYGPPLLLRGVRDVISAFAAACGLGLRARLVLYMRVDDEYTAARSREIKRHLDVAAIECRSSIEYVESRLSPAALSALLAGADVFVLPFKITASDVPLVIIEAAIHGKPVITFDTPGVSEWAEVFNNIVLSSPEALPKALMSSVSKPINTAEDPHQWADWKLALGPLSTALRTPIEVSALLSLRMVCLIGVDGSGKSALIARLSEQLGLQGHHHSYLWSRFRNYLSKPLLGLTRLTGHNVKKVIGGIPIGIHNFSGNSLLSRLFLLLQKWDMRLDMVFRYGLRKGLILGDRCPLDTLVDLAVDTGMDDYILGRYGREILAHLPGPSLIVMVTRPFESAVKARPDIAADPFHAQRVKIYRKLACEFSIPVVDNCTTIEDAVRKICVLAGEKVDA